MTNPPGYLFLSPNTSTHSFLLGILCYVFQRASPGSKSSVMGITTQRLLGIQFSPMGRESQACGVACRWSNKKFALCSQCCLCNFPNGPVMHKLQWKYSSPWARAASSFLLTESDLLLLVFLLSSGSHAPWLPSDLGAAGRCSPWRSCLDCDLIVRLLPCDTEVQGANLIKREVILDLCSLSFSFPWIHTLSTTQLGKTGEVCTDCLLPAGSCWGSWSSAILEVYTVLWFHDEMNLIHTVKSPRSPDEHWITSECAE